MKLKLLMLKQKIKNFIYHDLPMNLAAMLPRRIQLWCFILVYGADGNGPDKTYENKYENFVIRYKIKGM